MARTTGPKSFGRPLPDKMREPAYHVLRLMMDKGRGVTFTEAADALGGSRAWWSWHIAYLEREGFIDRRGERRYDKAVVNYPQANMLSILKGDPLPYGKTEKASYSKGRRRGLAPDGGTRYKKSVRAPKMDRSLLQPGRNNEKLGHSVVKGRFAGHTLYSLTLEEGKSCPPCDLADVCYGGNMPFARRWAHGEALERTLRYQVPRLPGKVLLRLHVLGDFYSVPYTEMWTTELGVPVFGYTHHSPSSPIGRAIMSAPWENFAVRFSWKAGHSGAQKRRGAVTITEDSQAEDHDAIICPVQTNKAESCATCGLCWNTQRNIAFRSH